MYKLTCRQFFKLTFVFVLLLSGCRQSEPAANPATEPPATPTAKLVPSSPLTEAFPGEGSIAGWTPAGELEVYDSETIFNLVDGQADFFFVYGFEQVAVRRYKNVEEVVLDIHIWQVLTPENAYGLFTASVTGEPADIGNEGDTDPGRRLVFWQDRYVAQFFSRKDIPDADLQAFGKAISAALPTGGERPALVDRLPAGGLVLRSSLFFHEELSIQNDLWLGGENILGLSSNTDGVLGRYEIDGATVRLLLIEYPDAGAASAGLAALQTGQVEDLLTVQVQDTMLVAVFGAGDPTNAATLTTKVLDKVDNH